MISRAAGSLSRRAPAAYFPNPAPGNLDVFDGIQDSAWGKPPAFPSGAGGLVSTVDDDVLFARMLLNKGKHGSKQILSAQSVESMTTDQLMPGQKVGFGFSGKVFDSGDPHRRTAGRSSSAWPSICDLQVMAPLHYLKLTAIRFRRSCTRNL